MKDKILLRKFTKGKIKENTKERMIDWCEEYKLNRITLLNYTERGKIGKLPLILIMLRYLTVLQLLYFILFCIVYFRFISFFCVCVHTNNFLLQLYVNLLNTILFILIYSIRTSTHTKLHRNTMVQFFYLFIIEKFLAYNTL